jgi:K+-transporting ATPase ATPase C chain
VGSELLAQKFASERYFWPRPSAIDYNTLSSGGSNLGQASAALKKAYDERRAALAAAHPGAGDPPQELLFASGSGLDPHIRPSSAEYQVARVAKARGLEPSAVRALAIEAREGRQLGVFGEPRVNVLKLNLALDRAQGILGAPKLAPPPAAAPGSTPGGMGGS